MKYHLSLKLDSNQFNLESTVDPLSQPPKELKTLYFYFVYKKDKYRWRLKQIPVVFRNHAERDVWLNVISTTLLGERVTPKPMRTVQ